MKKNKRISLVLLKREMFVVLCCVLFIFSASGQMGFDMKPTLFLEKGFENPPPSAKARFYYHWLNGNVSRKGITADLEAMKSAGIQEAQLFNVKLGLPNGGLDYLSTEWLDMLHFTAREVKRLGLELILHNGPGWSSSGGPWIEPENAMKEVVYSQIMVAGKQHLVTSLPQPETRLDYYRDIAVLAFPKPELTYKVKGLDYKTLSGKVRNHVLPDTTSVPGTAIVKQHEIVNLTSLLSSKGILTWDVPEGEWIILRLGYTPVGTKNRPAGKGGEGLECDKMNKAALEAHWQGGIQPIIEKLDTLVGTALTGLLVDSYEVGTCNWTDGFQHEFERLRGYDCIPYLPALAGFYVESGEITERFLWDFRRTIGDLIAQNYYDYFRELCHQQGLSFSLEPYWGPFDNMQVGAAGDIVMSEFWSGGYPFFDSPKFVSSIAHLNGCPIAGSEAFTGIGGWDRDPAMLKVIGDKAWAEGINRFVLHCYVHQPWDVGPGLELSYHGTDFNRLNTWWKPGKAWFDYLARSQFLLQQGKNVADVLIFTGESSPNDAFVVPEVKKMGFDYDLIGPNKLDGLYVENNTIVSASGNHYKVLALGESEWMRPKTLEKIKQLVEAGATIIGHRPVKSPGLSNYPDCDRQVKMWADELWGKQLVRNIPLVDFLQSSELIPDFSVIKGEADEISFVHRAGSNFDLYFLANGSKQNREMLCNFRVSGRQPEIWNAQTGEHFDVAVWDEKPNGTTEVPLTLAPEDAVFVVFRKPSPQYHITKINLAVEPETPEKLLNLEIVKAEYGTFLQEGLVDVTDRVAGAVKNGKLAIRATRAFMGSDPAMGYAKEFRVEYSIGDKVYQLSEMERDSVIIDAAGKGELQIRKAVFGKFLPETKGVPSQYPVIDVTKKVQALIRSGVFEIPVNNSLIDGTLLPGDRPALRIAYKNYGMLLTQTVYEGQILKLSKNEPFPELYCENGKSCIISSIPFELTYAYNNGKKQKVEMSSVPAPVTLDSVWTLSFPLKDKQKLSVAVHELTPWNKWDNPDIRYFSGTAVYSTVFTLQGDLLTTEYVPELDLGDVFNLAEVWVNGRYAGTLWKAPFRLQLKGLLNNDKNYLEIRVTNLWPNRLIGDEQLPADYKYNQSQMIAQWPDWLLQGVPRTSERTTLASYKHWSKDSELLPSGLTGPVQIRFYRRMVLE